MGSAKSRNEINFRKFIKEISLTRNFGVLHLFEAIGNKQGTLHSTAIDGWLSILIFVQRQVTVIATDLLGTENNLERN